MTVPHNMPTLGSDEAAVAARVIAGRWVAQGPEVRAFEDELCRWFGLPLGHAVAVSSGSAALFIALTALKARGKRDGVPVYSCAALPNAVHLAGAEPVFLDTAPNSPNFDPEAAGGVQFDILIAPSIFGVPAQLPAGLRCSVIEDIAQSFGARVGGKPVGLRGDIGVCSFYATKMFTSAGQGGAVIARNGSLVAAMQDFRHFDGRHDRLPRFNLQMTDVQAAVGRCQLERLGDFIGRRERLFGIYRRAGLPLLDAVRPSHMPVRYRAVVRTERPGRVIEALREDYVQAIVPVEPCEILTTEYSCPNAYALARSTVSLPIFPELPEAVAARIADLVKKVL